MRQSDQNLHIVKPRDLTATLATNVLCHFLFIQRSRYGVLNLEKFRVWKLVKPQRLFFGVCFMRNIDSTENAGVESLMFRLIGHAAVIWRHGWLPPPVLDGPAVDASLQGCSTRLVRLGCLPKRRLEQSLAEHARFTRLPRSRLCSPNRRRHQRLMISGRLNFLDCGHHEKTFRPDFNKRTR